MPTIDQLAPTPAATDNDAFPASQAGIARRITRAQILAGTQPQITLPGGALLGRSSLGLGGPEAITIGAGLTFTAGTLAAAPAAPNPATPVVTPEMFGAVADGITDTTNAILQAVATLRPVQFGAGVYAVRGQCTIAVPADLRGIPGQTILRQLADGFGGAWISIQGASVRLYGLVFDGNAVAPAAQTWNILLTAACLQSHILSCAFINARGATLGNGLTILASDPARSAHLIADCEFAGNTAHGLWAQAVDGLRVTQCRAHDNAGYGICVDFNDPALTQAARLAAVTDNTCWSNDRGISVGNFNATNAEPPVWGNANPDAIDVLLQGNVCDANLSYGIAVSGRGISVANNLINAIATTNAGLLANCAWSLLHGNTITGPSHYGIDAGGSIGLTVANNVINGPAIGINPGGSTNVQVTANTIAASQWAITVYNVETDANGVNFGLATSNLTIAHNAIVLSGSAGGILLMDAPQGVAVRNNSFSSQGAATIDQALNARTDSLIVTGNTWNNAPRLFANPVMINGLQTVQLPEIADTIMISVAPSPVQSIMTPYQLATAGQIGFIKLTNPGSGYSKATVNISGQGTGATALAHIRGGALIGIALTAPGHGYGSSSATATVTINGDGVGATASASISLPVPDGRRFAIACNTTVRFARAGSLPFQENWWLTDVTVPANATIGFTGTFNTWRADAIPLADFITSPGDGSLALRSQAGGDLIIQPSANGHVRIASDHDPAGYLALTGHGSPDGVLAAPPGSDYRNLDGGAGQTLWIKRAGTDAHGWFAIA